MSNNYDNLPEILKEKEQWVLYKLAGNMNLMKFTKVPYDINGNKASTTRPDQWSDFTSTVSVLNNEGTYSGIGYVFSEQDNIVGIDFDTCIENGVIDPIVEKWIKKLNSYTEYSQSGNGLHILLQARLDTSYKNIGTINKIKCEVYNKARYFVMTGNTYDGLNEVQMHQS
jgi:putative DNA primase/helicase